MVGYLGRGRRIETMMPFRLGRVREFAQGRGTAFDAGAVGRDNASMSAPHLSHRRKGLS
jgi:hypothetical protein